MFANHPELIHVNLFNRGNQAQGAQQRALAASIATFATRSSTQICRIRQELLSRIGHKHASLGVTADQYPIVHENLFAAIVAVLGAETVTDESRRGVGQRVLDHGADTDRPRTRSLRACRGSDGDVYRRARVVSRVDDPSGAVLLTVQSSGAPFGDFLPGGMFRWV